jgi:hypothetical protein
MSAVWTPPKTWGTEVLTSGDMNAHLRDNLLFLHQNASRRIAQTVVTGTDVSSIVIGSIPVVFRHFLVVFQGHATGESSRVLQWRANFDATDNYQRMRFDIDDTAVPATSSDGEASSGILGLVGTSRGAAVAHIVNAQQKPQSGFTSYTGMSYRSMGPSSQALTMSGGRWRSSANITTFEVRMSVPFEPGASVSLYGMG